MHRLPVLNQLLIFTAELDPLMEPADLLLGFGTPVTSWQ